MDIQTLTQKFSHPHLRFLTGNGGLTKILLTPPHATAEIYLHGAHVTHYQPAGQSPVLMLSRKSFFEPNKPIRGGVPLCWPWFSQHPTDPTKPMHGFARLTQWDVLGVSEKNANLEVQLGLKDTSETRSLWPHSFQATYTICLGPAGLSLSFRTLNTGSDPFSFTQALHPYFAISDIKQISLTGLENISFAERIYQPEIQPGIPTPLQFTRRTDRVYYNSPKPGHHIVQSIQDPISQREIIINSVNAQTTVVWNPWSEWPKTVPDFAEDEWPGMLCVEPSNVHHFPITLQPNQSHTLSTNFSARARP